MFPTSTSSATATAAAACAARRKKKEGRMHRTCIPAGLVQLLMSALFTDATIAAVQASQRRLRKKTPPASSDTPTTSTQEREVLVLVTPTGKRWAGWVEGRQLVFPDGTTEDLDPSLVDPTPDEVDSINQHLTKVAKMKQAALERKAKMDKDAKDKERARREQARYESNFSNVWSLCPGYEYDAFIRGWQDVRDRDTLCLEPSKVNRWIDSFPAFSQWWSENGEDVADHFGASIFSENGHVSWFTRAWCAVPCNWRDAVAVEGGEHPPSCYEPDGPCFDEPNWELLSSDAEWAAYDALSNADLALARGEDQYWAYRPTDAQIEEWKEAYPWFKSHFTENFRDGGNTFWDGLCWRSKSHWSSSKGDRPWLD